MTEPIWERGQEGGKIRPINRDSLFKNLVEVTDILNKFNIRWWLGFGTMLGAYRDGNFIEWDDDADIGLDYLDRDKIEPVLTILRAKGFFIPHNGEEGMPHFDTVFIRDGEKIEGWWFERIGDSYIYDKERCGNHLKHPAKYYDKLQDFKFRGKNFKIPNHIEDYLVMMYSEDWRIPQRGRKYNNQKE